VHESWNIHNEIRDAPASAVEQLMRIADACKDVQWPRVEELIWYMHGGFASINPILRSRDPRRVTFGDHRDQPWLRERVQRAVREIDGLPWLRLDHDLTVWRSRVDTANLPETGSVLRDQAYLSCSLREDTARNLCQWHDKTPTGKTQRSLWQITIPAGVPLLPAYLLYLGDSDIDDPMIINEAEILLARNAYLQVDKRRDYVGGRSLMRATVVMGRMLSPASELLPDAEQVAA
jgi:hypothetical protein